MYMILYKPLYFYKNKFKIYIHFKIHFVSIFVVKTLPNLYQNYILNIKVLWTAARKGVDLTGVVLQRLY